MVFQHPRSIINIRGGGRWYPVLLVSDALVQRVLGSLVLTLHGLEGEVKAADHRLVSASSVVQLQLQGFILRQQARPVGGDQVALQVFLLGHTVDVNVKRNGRTHCFITLRGLLAVTRQVYNINHHISSHSHVD